MLPRRLKASSGSARFTDAKSGLDAMVKFECVDGPPWAEAWSNINFLLSETLRSQFDPENIVKLECRAIPDTEAEYSITASVLTKPSVRLHQVRKEPKGRKPISGRLKKETVVVNVEEFRTDNTGLDGRDRRLLSSFNKLNLQERIYFWQEYIAPHFR
jgi:hypothetical protein